MKEEFNVKWYDKTWFLWVLFILMPYFGIVLVWLRKKEYSKKKKIVISVILGLYTLLIITSESTNTETNIDSGNENQSQISKPTQNNSEIEKEKNNTNQIDIDLPEFDIINNDSYIRDEKKCSGFHVVVADKTSEEDMRNIFNEVVKDDSSYLRTVWFYSLESDVEDIGTFTVGMLEELTVNEKNDKQPTFTEPTISGDTLIAMREKSPKLSDLKTQFEKDMFKIVLENNSQLLSIQSIITEESEEVSVVAGVLCENNEEVVNKIIDEVEYMVINNEGKENIVITFGDIKKGEESELLVMATISNDGNSDVNVMSSGYNSAKNNWVNSQFSLWNGTHRGLEKLIKDNLNDEKSYDHIETTYIDVNSEDMKDNVNGILSDAGYSNRVEIDDLLITTKFSAKNGFGATIKNTAIGIAKYKNNSIILVAIE